MQTQSKKIEFKDYFSFKREFIIYNMRNLQNQNNNILTKKIKKHKKFPFPKFDASQSLTFNDNYCPTFNVDSLQDASVRLMMANVANNVK
jgi:hypothetical protein